MLTFIVALLVVFAVGMGIRRLLKKRTSPSVANAVPKVSFCPNCGTPADGSSAFCGSCGAKLK